MTALPLLLGLVALPARATSVKNPETYVYVTAADANSLDPAWSGDGVSQQVILNVYEPLFTFDGASTEKVVPLLAAAVPSRENGLLTEDGRTCTIPIREGVRFHDGTPLTPEDVRYSLMRFMIMDAGPAMMLLDPLAGYRGTRDSSGQLRATVFQDADKAVRIEDGKIVLRLPRPFPPLLPILARWSPIISKRWAVARGDWDGLEGSWTRFNAPKKEQSPFLAEANGTGPFKLERWDRKDRRIVLARNDDYWRKPARLKKVLIKATPEFSTRKLMLQAGDADAIAADRSVISQLQDIPGVRIIDDLPVFLVSPEIEFCFHISTTANPYIHSGRLDGAGLPPDFFTDKDVRKGFAYAFDYSGFIRDVQRGKGVQATGFIPRGMLGHNPAQKVYAFDLEKSASHLRKAWGGKVWEQGFRFSLVYNTGDLSREIIAQIIKRNVESLNPRFRIDLQPLDWPAYMDARDKYKAPLLSSGRYAPYPDPHAFAFQFMQSDPLDPCQYSSTESDRLVDAALVELDAKKRIALYHQLLELEHEDVPFLPIADSVGFRVERSWLKGWSYNPMVPIGGLFYAIHK